MNLDFRCDYSGPIVNTSAGKLRGYYDGGLYIFKGIKYADADRYMPPRPVKPWDGIKNCLSYGYIAPTINPTSFEEVNILTEFRWWPESEDCQYLNIWSTNINDDSRKPVMVWIHGGGFFCGSCLETMAYEPEKLCLDGDVVVVSINHRLNILGYFDLSDYGKEFANSGNLGGEDIVAALRWVKENIASFGGDPENVTVFGQSGGGVKCNMLMQTPAAQDLFNKVIIQSGVPNDGVFSTTHEQAAAVAKAVVDELGGIDRLLSVPFREIKDAFVKVRPGLDAQGIHTEWAPVPNHWFLGDPLLGAEPTEKFRNTPVIVGSCIAETLTWYKNYFDYTMPQEERLTLVQKQFGEHSEYLLELYEKAYPGRNILGLLTLDSKFRDTTIDYLDLRAKVSKAPTYNYILAYEFGFNGGTPAFHAAEHGLVFKSYRYLPFLHEPGVPELADRMSTAWSNFARYGCPDNEYLSVQWKPYTVQEANTLVFDRDTQIKTGHDKELVKFLARYYFEGQPPMVGVNPEEQLT